MLITFVEHWRPLAALTAFALLWLWESRAPYFPVDGRVRHAARNLAVALLNTVLAALVFAAATVAAAEYARRTGTGLLYWVSFNGVALSEPWRIALALPALDLWTYWWHRANHVVPLLWRFHRTHHSDPAMDVSTATRFHFGEIAISSFARAAVVLLVGVPLGAIVLFDFVLLLSTQFQHSNIALPAAADRLLRLALVSPNMHKVHHSEVRAEMDSNYTSVLSVWDRLFGTYHGSDDCKDIRFGVPGLDAERFQTLRGLLWTPFR